MKKNTEREHKTQDSPEIGSRAGDEIRRLQEEISIHTKGLIHANESLEREVSERRKAEEKLRKTVDELETFTYSVSHDLRAPMRAMQGVAEAMAEDYRDRLDATGLDYLGRIASAAQRMDNLMQDLLTYHRMGKDSRGLQVCSLDQAVVESRRALEKEIRESRCEMEVEQPLGSVQAYVGLLDMVVANLIGNALKFTFPGRRPKVRIRSENRTGLIRLWVEDNGIGIHPDHHEVIFKVFERLHREETYPGTGIGLAIVRKGVEKLGGSVGLDSTPGEGSRFWVEFPGGEKPAS
jgi:signal transduction histidine kinase